MPAGQAPRQEPPPDGRWAADRTDRVFTAGFIVIAVWSAIGLLLAAAGWYRVPVLLVACGLTSVAAPRYALRRLSAEGATALTPRTEQLWIAGWLALAATLFFRPGEYLIDGSDGSVYLNIGRALRQHDGLRFAEPVLRLIDPSQWAAFFSMGRGWPQLHNLFPGGVQVAPGENLVQPNFFHLFPVWVAHFETVAGMGAGYYTSPVFGALSIGAAWMLGRRLWSLSVANLTAGLLCLNFTQIWFARFPTSEILTQYFLLAGLYFTTQCARHGSRVMGVCAGAAFGLAAATRIDVLVLGSPLVAATLVLARATGRWHAGWTAMAVSFGGFTANALALALLVSSPYTLRIARRLFSSPWVSGSNGILTAALLVVSILAYVIYRRSPAASWLRTPTLGRAGGVLLLVVAAVRFGPELAGGYVAMVLTPPGIVLAIVGAAMVLARDRAPHVLLMAGLLIVFSLVYLTSPFDRAELPTLLRRFVPVILPLGVLFAAHAIVRIYEVTRLRLVAVAAALAVAILFVRGSAPIVAQAPMRGVHEVVAAAAALVPPGAVLIVDASTPSHFGLSLRYTFGRDVVWVRPATGTAQALEDLARRLATLRRPMAVAIGRDSAAAEALEPAHLQRLGVHEIGSVALEHVALESSSDRLPSHLRARAPIVDVYTATPLQPEALPLQIEIGDRDFPRRREGFHDSERMGPATARWTRDVAGIDLPRLAPVSRAALLLRLAAPRPPGAAAPQVDLTIDGRTAGATPPVPADFTIFELPLPPAILEALSQGHARLTLRTPTFVPRDRGAGDDARPLGVVVDWVRIEPR